MSAAGRCRGDVSNALREGLFIVAGAVLLLLFTGINNAWDAVAYHVLVYTARDKA